MSAFTYTTTLAGTYEMRITSYGQSVAGTPRPLPVRPAPTDVPSCDITSFPEEVIAGYGASAGIATFDRFKNPREVGGDPIEVTLVGNQTLIAELLDNEDSTYVAAFNVTVSGVYVSSFMIGDEHIAGSPHEFVIRPAEIEPAKCLSLIHI